MATSKLGLATRALVSVLLRLARAYLLCVDVTRESSEEALLRAYKKVVLAVHPDKGGKKEDAQELQQAKETCKTFSQGLQRCRGEGWSRNRLLMHSRLLMYLIVPLLMPVERKTTCASLLCFASLVAVVDSGSVFQKSMICFEIDTMFLPSQFWP